MDCRVRIREIAQSGVVRKHLNDWPSQVQSAHDYLGFDDLIPQQERDHDAGRASPSRAARAVQVRLLVFGRIEVHHAVDAVDVQTARSHVGGDQHG